ncbi:HEAT repeat domain-containing protein [Planctomycetales bacterium ZRK34]|nr:HEAT repeat domain-containing protein [Planctomycetales bacterium ZRK34]
MLLAFAPSMPQTFAVEEASDAARLETDRLDPAQQRELEHLLDDLRDANLDLDRRQRAALILLDHGWPAAIASMKQTLGHARDPLVQRAIARAVNRADQPDPQLIEPLMKLLNAEDPDLRRDVAGGLSRFNDPNLTRQLIDLASDDTESSTRRLGAIEALAQQRQPKVVAALVRLTTTGSQPLRDAAFEALAKLTGLTDLGKDPAAWQRWWVRNGKLPTPRWLAMLMQNLSAQSADLNRRLAKRTERLTQTYNNLYDATDEKGRGAILQQMLADELIELRLLALSLIERRVLNAQTIPDEVRVGMRKRLTDRDPAVRAKSATLLENVADTEAATLVIDLLLGESDPKAQSAYLALLARLPQREAVNPALLLLQRDDVRAAAATFLLAAVEKKLLTESQVDSALAVAREQMLSEAPEPAVIKLIGKIGDKSDQKRLVQLLTHEDPQVRLAAVNAFEDPHWPIDPMLERLNDPTLKPAIIQLIERRGSQGSTLIALLGAEPEDADLLAKWTAAAAAVAGRLTAEDLIKVDTVLSDQPERVALEEQILKAAANHVATSNGAGEPAPASTPAADARRDEASLRLATLYLRTDQPAKAKPIYEKLTARNGLSADHQRRLLLGQLELLLAQKQFDDAAAYTTKQLAPGSVLTADALAAPWLDAADKALAARNAADARTLTQHAARLLAGKLSAPLAARLTKLQAQTTPPATATP